MNEQKSQSDSQSSAGRRTGWSGVSERELTSPGGALTTLLLRAANLRGHQLGEMASELGVTYGYIAQLRNGHRAVQHISRQFARAVANYLSKSFGQDIPPILVLLIAGRIRIEDWLPVGEAGNERLRRGLERIASDPVVGGVMPAEIWHCEPSVQQLVVSLYDEVSAQDSFAHRKLPDLLDSLLQAAIVLDDRLPNNTMEDAAEPV